MLLVLNNLEITKYMEAKTKKRISIVLAIILIANISNILRSTTLTSVRAVDAIQLISCGMLAGALIVILVTKSKNKINS